MTADQEYSLSLMAGLCGEKVALRTDAPDVWKATLASCRYQPVLYTSASITYQVAYIRGRGIECEDCSMILHWNGAPCAVWPISCSVEEGRFTLDSLGTPLLPPLFVRETPASVSKRLCKACLDFLDQVASKHGRVSWAASSPFLDLTGLGDWHDEVMRRGAECRITHDLFLDLRPELAAIKSCLRKSYKSLITSGRREWTVGVMDSPDAEVWAEFKQLHFEVSGRHTRSQETWDLQLEQIGQEETLLVFLREGEGRMVGGGFFQFTRDEALYSVAAYDRNLFHKPLGHVVQGAAIEEFKRRGVRWYKIGRRFFPGDVPAPTEKEISISDFKSGFASHLFPEFILTRKLSHE